MFPLCVSGHPERFAGVFVDAHLSMGKTSRNQHFLQLIVRCCGRHGRFPCGCFWVRFSTSNKEVAAFLLCCYRLLQLLHSHCLLGQSWRSTQWRCWSNSWGPSWVWWGAKFKSNFRPVQIPGIGKYDENDAVNRKNKYDRVSQNPAPTEWSPPQNAEEKETATSLQTEQKPRPPLEMNVCKYTAL